MLEKASGMLSLAIYSNNLKNKNIKLFMNILFFHPWIKSKGGAEKTILEYIKRSKNNIIILTWCYDPAKTYSSFKNYNVVSLGNKIYNKFSRAFLFRGFFYGMFLSRKKVTTNPKLFDIFLISTSGIAELILLYNKELQRIKKKVLYCHTPLRATYKLDILYNLKYRFINKILEKIIYKAGLHIYNKLEKKAWKNIDFAIFNSELSKQRAIDKKLIDEEKTKVIYPGIDLKNLYYEEPEDYFLFVGRFGFAKRHHILIKAFAKFIKRYKGYKLYLVGGVENKKYFSCLLRLVKNYKLENNVKFFINIPTQHLYKIYAKCLAFLHPPFMEDYGIVPFEAAAAGKYIINVYPSGNYEILKSFPGVYWIKEKFYEEKMVKEFLKALEYFVKNEDKLIELGKENRKSVKKLDLSWDKFTREMDKTLNEIANS